MNVQFAFLYPELNGAGAFIGELGDAFDRFPQFLAVERHRMRMILGQYPLEVREVPGKLSAQQQAIAELEEQMVLVAGKLNHRVRVGFSAQLQNLAHGLARQKSAVCSGYSRQLDLA